MRIIIKNQEFFVFKNIYYTRPYYYFDNGSNTLAEKYFTSHGYRLPEKTKVILEMLTTSPKAKELVKKPELVMVSLDDQLKELLNFLEISFNIKMDERNRFSTVIESRVPRSFFKVKKVKLFFSWDEIIQLYNSSYKNINYLLKDNKYLSDKFYNLDSLNKKYAYLNLKRIKGKGFDVFSEQLISLPC